MTDRSSGYAVMTNIERLNRINTARLVVPVLGGCAALATIIVALRMQNGPGTMGLGFVDFVGIWTLMMAAMMLPALSRGVPSSAGALTPPGPMEAAAFATGYLSFWAVAGVVAFPAAVLAGWLSDRHAAIATSTAVVLCAVCAAYQVSPLRRHCLTHRLRTHLARSDTNHPRASQFRRGITHGGWCAACTWANMLVLLAFGLMNIAAMSTLAAVVYVEGSLRRSTWINYSAAVAILVCGIVIVVYPPFASGLHHATTMTMR